MRTSTAFQPQREQKDVLSQYKKTKQKDTYLICGQAVFVHREFDRRAGGLVQQKGRFVARFGQIHHRMQGVVAVNGVGGQSARAETQQ